MTKPIANLLVLTVLVLWGLLWGISCTDSIAGRSGVDETSNGIHAQVFGPDGKPLVGALVLVRPEGYIASSSLGHYPRAGIVNLITDIHGNFNSDSLPDGNYLLEVRHDQLGSMHSFRIPQDIHQFDSWLGDSLITQSTASIQGQVALPASVTYARIIIPGIDRVVYTDSAGLFQITGLPAGDFALLALLPDTAQVIAASRTTIQSGESITHLVLDPQERALSEWQHSVSIFLNTKSSGADIGTGLAHFPILVKLEGAYFPSGAMPAGSDLRIVGPDDEEIAFEVAWWDPGSARAHLWVLLDTVIPADSALVARVLWGINGVLSSSNPGGVFDTSLHWAGVWHLQKSYAGLGGKSFTPDATPGQLNGHLLSNNGTFPEFSASGAWFDGSLQGVGIHPFPLNLGREDYTMEMWIRPENEGAVLAHRSWEADNWNHHEKIWYLGRTGESVGSILGFQPAYVSWGEEYNNYNWSTQELSLHQWTHLTHRRTSISRDSSRYEWFIDGEPAAMLRTDNLDEWDDMRDSLYIARNAFGRGFQGWMRHFHISKVSRSADWIRLCHRMQLPGSSVVILQ